MVISVLRRMSGTQLFAIVVGIVVVVVVVFLISSDTLSFSGGDDEGPLGAETTSQSDGDATDSDTSAGGDASATGDGEGGLPRQVLQDEAFQFGHLRLAVTEINLSVVVSEGRDSVEAIERFATILLTVRNTDRLPHSLSGNLILIDGQGRQFTPNVAATAATAFRDDSRQDALTFDLQPGIDSDLVVVFDVPDEAEDFRLRLLGGFVDITLDR